MRGHRAVWVDGHPAVNLLLATGDTHSFDVSSRETDRLDGGAEGELLGQVDQGDVIGTVCFGTLDNLSLIVHRI